MADHVAGGPTPPPPIRPEPARVSTPPPPIRPVSDSVHIPNPPPPVKPSGFGKDSDESVAVNDPTFAAVVAGASLANGASTEDAVRTGIASAGFVGATNADMDYQRRWAAKRREARGWRKIWVFIWG